MAYDHRKLSHLVYSNGFTLWHYTTTDTADEAASPGYFNAAVDMLRAGDMILMNCTTSKALTAGIFFVVSSSAGVVSLCSMVQAGSGDTD